MKKNTGNKSTTEILRQKAEELLKNKQLSATWQFSVSEMIDYIES